MQVLAYHGSTSRFANFERRSSKRQDSGGHVFDVTSPCHFFAADRASALRFAKDRALIDERMRGLPRRQPVVRAYRLRIDRLLDFTISREVEERMWRDGFSPFYNPYAPSPYAAQLAEDITGTAPEDWNDVHALLDDEAFVAEVQKHGYDGVLLRENDGALTYAVFDPRQIEPVAQRPTRTVKRSRWSA